MTARRAKGTADPCGNKKRGIMPQFAKYKKAKVFKK
jgi:hypothetical protein